MSRDAGPPLLRDPACTELRPRWSGDPIIDTALACWTAKQGATQLFGADRTTRAVVRGFAGSLLGPEGQAAERDAALFASSLVLAVDGSADGERLVGDDLIEILHASTRWDVVPRREPIHLLVRQRLRALLEGTSRQRRTRLALELLGDLSGTTDRVLRVLARTTMAPAAVYPTDVATLDQLDWAVAVLADHRPLRSSEVSSILAPHLQRPRIHLRGGYEIRLLTAFPQAVTEGWQMGNCLATTFQSVVAHHHTLLTVHRNGQPVATVELDPAGDIRQLLGPANRYLGRGEQLHVEQLLVEASVLDAVAPDRPRGPSELVAARIACQAAAVLASEFDAELDPHLSTGREPGDEVLEMLGRRSSLLSDDELRQLRAGSQQPRSLTEQRTDWQRIGAMLVVSHVKDGVVESLDGSPGFQIAVAGYARRILAGTFILDERPPHPDLGWLVEEPGLSAPIRAGIGEVLRYWRAGQRPAR